MSQSKGKSSIVNQTIILHSPQFSINNTFFEQNNKTNGQQAEKQNINQDKTAATLQSFSKQQQQQTGNYYQINQLSTINNNTITCNDNHNNNSSSISYSNKNSSKHPSSIVHPQITQSTFATMTIPASSIIPSHSRNSTLQQQQQQQQPASQSLTSTHGQQFMPPPPPPPSKSSRGISRPKSRTNQQAKRQAGNVSPLKAQYENKLISSQAAVPGIRSNSQYPASINRWIDADEDVLISGELQRIASQDKRSRERLEKNSQLQLIYGRASQSKQYLQQQQQIIGYSTVQNSYVASIDSRSNNIPSRQPSVQRRRGQNLVLSQRPQESSQTISQNRQQGLGTELNFRSISNERSSLMNGRNNQRFDSILVAKKPNGGGSRLGVQSSERPARIAQIGGGVYLPIAAPMSAMEIGEYPRARSTGRSRSQGRKRNARIGASYEEDGREEGFSKGSFLNEIAQKKQFPIFSQNQEINPQKLWQQQQMLQQTKQQQIQQQQQQQQQVKPSQMHPGRCLVVSSGKQSETQMQDKNVPPIVEIPIPRPLLKNDSKENINLQSEQTSDFFDAYVRGLIQTDNFSTSNYDRLSSSQVERNPPPQPLEDNNLFLFEKNLDPNRSFSDLPESGSATAYDGQYNGVGFFNSNSNTSAKQNPDSCKIKKIMQFYTGQITKGSNRHSNNNNHNPTFSSINSFGLKVSGENNTTPKDLSFLQSPSLVVAQHSRELEFIDVVDQSFGGTLSQFLPPHPPRNQEDIDKKKESPLLSNYAGPLVTFCDSPRVMEKQQPQLLEVNSKKQFRRNTSKIRQRNNLLNRDTLRDSKPDEQQANRIQQMKEHLQLESYDKSTLIPLPPQANLPRPKHNRNQLNTILFNHALLGGANHKPQAGQEEDNSQRNKEQIDSIPPSIEKSECSERNLPDKSECSERNPVEEMSTVQKDDDYDEREYKDEFENDDQIDRTRQTAAFNSQFDQMITNSLQNYLNTSSDCQLSNQDSQKCSQ